MGYRDDGSFNFGGKTLSPIDDPKQDQDGITEGGKVNAPFVFPDKSVRFLEAEAALEKSRNRGIVNNLSYGDYKLHRGYIRNLEQPAFGEVPISRCNFQFNPQEIRQDVSMREGVYLPLLQTKEQLSQPMGAITNFAFDLLFDRSHEVAKGNTINNIGKGGDPLSIDPLIDPQEIGVLADLRILYSVIGQGFSTEMIKFQMTNFQNVVALENKEETDPEKKLTAEQLVALDGEINKVIEANYGNFAFLMPNPVRVLFSSLFMLDGFVTGTSVNFLKFSTKMVPLQCRVTINMQAMYIGFARQKTFLTDVFEDAARALAAERSQKSAALTELRQALLKTAYRFTMVPIWTRATNIPDYWTSIANPSSSIASNNYLPVWAQGVIDRYASDVDPPGSAASYRGLILGFPAIRPNKGQQREIIDGTEIVTGRDTDEVLKLFESDSPLTISYSWYIRVYGKKQENSALTANQANEILNNKTYNRSNNKYGATLIGSYSGTETASSKDEWGAGADSKGTGDVIRRKVILGYDQSQDPKLRNTGSGYNFGNTGSVAPWFKNGYYIVEMGVSCTATVAEAGSLTTESSSVRVLSGTQPHRTEFLLNWTTGAGDGYFAITPVNPQIRDEAGL